MRDNRQSGSQWTWVSTSGRDIFIPSVTSKVHSLQQHKAIKTSWVYHHSDTCTKRGVIIIVHLHSKIQSTVCKIWTPIPARALWCLTSMAIRMTFSNRLEISLNTLRRCLSPNGVESSKNHSIFRLRKSIQISLNSLKISPWISFHIWPKRSMFNQTAS